MAKRYIDRCPIVETGVDKRGGIHVLHCCTLENGHPGKHRYGSHFWDHQKPVNPGQIVDRCEAVSHIGNRCINLRGHRGDHVSGPGGAWPQEKLGNDAVDHPSHYTSHPSGIECIQVTEHMGFCLGNAVKYIWRAGLKGDEIEDLRKARWYLDREIARREKDAPMPGSGKKSEDPACPDP